MERSSIVISLLEKECDYIEIGIPSSFAKYDGPIIRRSYEIALKNAVVEQIIREIKTLNQANKIVLTYLNEWISKIDNENPLSSFNFILFPDLIIDYYDQFDELRNKMNLTLFVSPSVPDYIIKKVSQYSRPFLYLGIRPTTGVVLPVNIETLISRVKRLINNKLIVGFGLKDREEILLALKAGADGIAIGTSLISPFLKHNFVNALEKLKENINTYKEVISVV
jgi:tryptophan synthase alpha chain